MAHVTQQVQSADWKSEKHVPVIECNDQVKANEVLKVTVTVGKEIAHPNTTEHHIRWIALFFQPEGDKFTYELGRFECNAHGESAEGPNTGPVYSEPTFTVNIKISKNGSLQALAFCNIHGLWQSGKDIQTV